MESSSLRNRGGLLDDQRQVIAAELEGTRIASAIDTWLVALVCEQRTGNVQAGCRPMIDSGRVERQ